MDFWSRTRNVDIHVGPEDYQKIDAYFRRWNINYNIINNDLQKSVEEEEKGHYRHSHGWHGSYHDFEEVGLVLSKSQPCYLDVIKPIFQAFTDLIQLDEANRPDAQLASSLWVPGRAVRPVSATNS